MKAKDFDAMVKGVALIAKAEAQKAAAPLVARITALEAENGVLRAAIRDLNEKNTLAAITPDALRARYQAMQ